MRKWIFNLLNNKNLFTAVFTTNHVKIDIITTSADLVIIIILNVFVILSFIACAVHRVSGDL